jgi:hypothetical protein
LVATLAACSRGPSPGETEEVPTATEKVPAVVREAAAGFCDRLGGARCEQWYWDREDEVWECILSGLSRRAEIDVVPDGSFSELELVYEYAEIESILPDIAEFIRTKCRGGDDVFVELSLRREAYLDDIPDLEEAWSMSGVVLEFQCPNGRDFEIDARGMGVESHVDDRSDGGPADR